MGRYGGSYDVRYARRDARQRRLRFLSYIGLAALAVVTSAVVVLALER